MTAHARQLTRVMTVALGSAMITGAIQVVIGALRHLLAQDFIWVSREYVWMTPLGYVVLFVCAAIPLLIAGAIWSRARDVRVSGFVFGTLGTLALVLLIPGLYHLAALVVAVGIGTRVAAGLAADEPRRLRALRRLTVGLALALGIAGVARAAWRLGAGRAAVAALPVAPPDAPNVLVVILDTVRAASMSFLGYPRPTMPHLATLGADGAVFEHAFSTAPWTLPSHAGMFTGRYPSQTSADWSEPLDGAAPVLAEVLAARGYRTGAFVANHFYTSYESGIVRGFEHVDDYRLTLRQVLLSTTLTHTHLFNRLLHERGVLPRLRALAGMNLRLQTMWVSDRKAAPEVTDEFLTWHARLPRDRPFFAFLNYYDAHLPYDPPTPWRTKFASDPVALDLYDASIAYIDESLGRLTEELRRRGVLDRTLVIVTSDHGELFGEHGLHEHGNSLYLPELHVPLVVRYPPRVPHGVRPEEPVTLRDLAATALDAVGMSGTTQPLPGASWLPLTARGARGEGSAVIAEVSAGVNAQPTVPVSRGAMRSLITDSTHYILNGDGVEEVFAWRRDRAETVNLAADPGINLDGLREAIGVILGKRTVPASVRGDPAAVRR